MYIFYTNSFCGGVVVCWGTLEGGNMFSGGAMLIADAPGSGGSEVAAGAEGTREGAAAISTDASEGSSSTGCPRLTNRILYSFIFISCKK